MKRDSENDIRKCISLILEVESTMPVRQKIDIDIPQDLQDIHRRIKNAGRELYLVGGAVRDVLLGKTPKDYDLATNSHPDEVIKILNRNHRLRID